MVAKQGCSGFFATFEFVKVGMPRWSMWSTLKVCSLLNIPISPNVDWMKTLLAVAAFKRAYGRFLEREERPLVLKQLHLTMSCRAGRGRWG